MDEPIYLSNNGLDNTTTVLLQGFGNPLKKGAKTYFMPNFKDHFSKNLRHIFPSVSYKDYSRMLLFCIDLINYQRSQTRY